jgi:anti-sigma B factor antagonist
MLNVELSIGDFDGQAVIALRGRLSLADAPDVASHLIAAVAACGPWVIVDLADLEGIGYGGLSVLLRVRKWTRRSGGDLPLAAPQQPVRQILEATGLIDIFAVYPSVEEAALSAGQVQPWPPAAAQRPPAVMVTRSGSRWPVCRAARHSPVRPLPRRGSVSSAQCRSWSWKSVRRPGGCPRSWAVRRP